MHHGLILKHTNNIVADAYIIPDAPALLENTSLANDRDSAKESPRHRGTSGIDGDQQSLHIFMPYLSRDIDGGCYAS